MVFPKECEGNSWNDQYHIFLNNIFVSFYTLHSISLTGMYYCYAMFYLEINSTCLVHMWYLKNENLKNLFFKWTKKIIVFVFWDQISAKISNFQLSMKKKKKKKYLLRPIALNMPFKTKCRWLMGKGGWQVNSNH